MIEISTDTWTCDLCCIGQDDAEIYACEYDLATHYCDHCMAHHIDDCFHCKAREAEIYYTEWED